MVNARGEPGRLEPHQRYESVNFGLPRQQAGEHAAKAQRLVGQSIPTRGPFGAPLVLNTGVNHSTGGA